MKYIKYLILLTVSLLFMKGFAKDPVYTPLFNNNSASGYDVVAYFKEDKAVKGKKDFKTEYRGANWLFSTKENLDLFKKEPEKYAPQYGGYCAYALAVSGDLVSSDPKAWTIYNSKLYMNYSISVRDKWRGDKDNFIKKADSNWEKFNFK